MSTRRVIEGRRLDGTYGFDVSLKGYDALLDNRFDASKFAFSSDWINTAKIHMVSKAVLSATITHGLGYYPFFDVRQCASDSSWVRDDYVWQVASGGWRTDLWPMVTPTTLQPDFAIPYTGWLRSQAALDSTWCVYIIYAEAFGTYP